MPLICRTTITPRYISVKCSPISETTFQIGTAALAQAPCLLNITTYPVGHSALSLVRSKVVNRQVPLVWRRPGHVVPSSETKGFPRESLGVPPSPHPYRFGPSPPVLPWSFRSIRLDLDLPVTKYCRHAVANY